MLKLLQKRNNHSWAHDRPYYPNRGWREPNRPWQSPESMCQMPCSEVSERRKWITKEMNKPNKTILRHTYQGIDFIIVLTDPSQYKPINIRKDFIDAYCRYPSLIGVFVTRIELSKAFVRANSNHLDYIAQVCLEKYEEQKGNRIKSLIKSN